MFVFPALNSSFKSRKRTFRCCDLCRSKRTKCDITGVNFEVEGCGNCRKHGWKCSFIKERTVKIEPADDSVDKGSWNFNSEPISSPVPLFEELVPSDMKKVNVDFLREKFNFQTSAFNSDSSYQYVYQEHPMAIMNAKTNDDLVWHQSGVVVDMDAKNSLYKLQGFGGRPVTNYISNRNTYKYLLLIHAFTLSSPEFTFRDNEVTKLLEIYFFKINSIFPIVHEKRFWDDYRENKANSILKYAIILAVLRDKMAEPILRRVLLRGKNFLSQSSRSLDQYPETEFLEDFNYFLEELETKIRQINLILPKLGDVEKLTKLVVLLLLTMHYRADRLGNEQNSHDLTAAINLGVSMGIHMKPENSIVSEERIKYSTNLWWCCFILDRFNAVTNSRCLFINQDDFNIDVPYSNINLLRMVQRARVLENMLLTIYRPNIRANNLTSDVKSRLEIFNLDEFRVSEFDYCDKEIASGSPMFTTPPDTNLSNEDLEKYVSDTMRFMTRIINNLVIIVSQKTRFSNPAIDNLIPRKDMIKAGANLLWYIRQLDERLMINIPMITWALSISMASYLKVQAMSILHNKAKPNVESIVPHYELEDFLCEMKKYKGKWWIVDELYNLTSDFMAKLELSSKRNGEHEFTLPDPKRARTVSDTENVKLQSNVLSRTLSIPSIQNIIHASNNYHSPTDIVNTWEISSVSTNEYDKFFESMHVDIFDNEFFKDLPNVINTL